MELNFKSWVDLKCVLYEYIRERWVGEINVMFLVGLWLKNVEKELFLIIFKLYSCEMK